jgi:ribonucleotide monophosphatase NagD (HAD superfamily)
MHNGKDALDGAKELIDLMISKNKKLIILSNTSSPSKTTLNRLNNLGFNSKDFLTAITSGEEACKYIKTKYGNESNDNNNNNDVNKNKNKNKKKKFIWFTWDYPHNENVPNPMDFIDQLGGDSSNIEPTINIDEADFIVAHGTGVIRGSGNSDTSDTTTNNIISIGNFINDDTDWYKIDEILKECSKRNLPMICANPDYIVKYHDGTIKNMPGQIANRYITKFNMNNSNNKNETIIFGKPNPEHFSCCINEIYKNYNEENSQNQNYNNNNNKENSNNEPQQRKQKQQKQKHLRIAHVGDSISHDIAGANSVNGIDSIFIIGGIHSDDELLRVQVEVESKSAIEKNVNDNGENDNDNNNDNNVHVQSQSQSKSKLPSEKQLKEFFDNQGHTPTHVVPMFQI